MPSYRPGRSAEVAMAEHGLDRAVKLASNELPFGPLPSVAAAIHDAVGNTNRYPDHCADALRSALADRLGVTRDRVAVGCGSVGLIQQLALAFAGPGDEVAFAWPSFEAYPIVSQLVGAGVATTPLRRQTVDAGDLASSTSERTRLVLLANANNPTGTALRTDELLRLADTVPDDCLLVVDEAYHEFATGADVPDAFGLLGERANVAVLRTFSKAHGLAALRVGYMVAAPEVVVAVDKALVPFSVNSIGQAAALAALHAEGELASRVASVVAERDRVARQLRRRGHDVPDTQANFVWLPAGSTAADVALKMERAGVVTRPFAGLGVRVTIGTPADNDRFLDAIGPGPGCAAANWLERLDAVEQRLVTSAAVPCRGLTAPDPDSGERWDASEIWAHLAEFGRYWLKQLDRVLGGEEADFGRAEADLRRTQTTEVHRRRPAQEGLETVTRSIDGLRARLCELTTDDWSRAGRHPTLGSLDLAKQLDLFHVGRYEQHAAQLEQLAAR